MIKVMVVDVCPIGINASLGIECEIWKENCPQSS